MHPRSLDPRSMVGPFPIRRSRDVSALADRLRSRTFACALGMCHTCGTLREEHNEVLETFRCRRFGAFGS
jgi:hypothetical protein